MILPFISWQNNQHQLQVCWSSCHVYLSLWLTWATSSQSVLNISELFRACFLFRGGGGGGVSLWFLNSILSAVFVSWDISSSIADHPEPRCQNSFLWGAQKQHDNRTQLTAFGDRLKVHTCWCTLKYLYVLSFQLSMWPVIPSFAISAKEHRVTGALRIKPTTQAGMYGDVLFSLIIRYECPAGCLDATGKVVGTVYYEMVRIYCLQRSQTYQPGWSVLL